MITLEIRPRATTGSDAAHALRTEGRVPAVIYGAKQEAIPVSVSLAEVEAVLRKGGETSVIELTGLDKPMQVLMHDIDRNPTSGAPYHIDFYAVVKGAKVTMSLPLSFVGDSEAVRMGANLVKVLHEVEVEAAPDKLPHEIEVDVTALVQVGDQIHVSNLKAPAGVTFVTGGEEVVALAQEPAGEEVEGPALDMEAIEVEQKGKTEEEEA